MFINIIKRKAKIEAERDVYLQRGEERGGHYRVKVTENKSKKER